VIRAGRQVVDNRDIAEMAGYGSLRSAQRAKLFEDPDMPAPITHGKYKKLWDREQIHAWVHKDPIPELPSVDSPDDLLDQHEVMEMLGIPSYAAWRKYEQLDREREERGASTFQLPEIAADAPAGTYYARRADVENFVRPGPGRTKGATDKVLRASRSERTARDAVVYELVKQTADDRPVTAAYLAAELEVSSFTALQALRRAKVRLMLERAPSGRRVTAGRVAAELGCTLKVAREVLEEVREAY
jgi:hypothetical protein